MKSETYEHPFDRKALASLEKMPGVSLLLKKVNEYGIDRLLRLQCLGSDFRVTPTNFPGLSQALEETCQILDLSPCPGLYLFRGWGHIITVTIGIESPIITVNLEAYEWLSSQELIYVLGHEVAHIKSQHLLYHQIAMVMPLLKTWVNAATLGFGGLAANGVELAFWNWLMMARFTADRAGLLACQDVDVAITALMKLGGLPSCYVTPETIADFLVQVREFSENSVESQDTLTKLLSFNESTQSWVVMRASELLKWVDSGDYKTLLEQPNQPPPLLLDPDATEDWNFLTSW
ncbi:M48 family metallopeptidase [Microcoleus sp. N3A4]|uniref:M48 family metallopeptidase n=1 Tax=Microcoleus sp. N3A4 TaxID=3055379 RepID=UPI002FD60AF3